MVVLMTGLMLFHFLSIQVFTSEKLETVLSTDQTRLLEKVAAISRMLADTSKEYHEVMIAALNDAMPDVRFRHGELDPDASLANRDEETRQRLETLIDRPGVRVLAAVRDASMDREWHLVVVMPDDHQVVFTTHPAANQVPLLRHATISVSLMGGAVLLFSWLAVRHMTTPLRQIVRAAETFGRDLYAAPLPEEGSLETRKVAQAFNAMNASIREYVEERTRMIAAISHDLRTPLTRLRLRLEFVQPQADRNRMTAILDEMDAMLTATLAFARDAATETEARRRVNLAGLLATICDELQDQGLDVAREEWERLPYACRPLAMRRALTNLVLNAVRHGGAARVMLDTSGDGVAIEIRDPGEGIPQNEWENVFKPFYRLDAARSRQGAGLGLSVARSVIHDHGGRITFQHPEGGGFVVRVTLP
ncbi:MAG: HAMP domain-containing protein [Magnetococcales bacterium]|nr:HAMP domain-containing protein [Magnetococcales bacterium]